LALARAVTMVSSISTGELTLLLKLFLLRTISVGPVCSTTRPTEEAQLVRLSNANVIAIASAGNCDTLVQHS
jgi:hypothetical protein